MNESIIAVRYAKALYQLAEEKKSVEPVFADMSLILDIAKESEEFTAFLDSPIIKPGKKIQISTAILTQVSPLTSTFLNTLYTNRRENMLTDIARKYVSMINSQKNITVATIYTTTTLQQETKNKITELVSKKFRSNNVELVEKIDESLIGGFIIKVNDQQLDASISTRLSEVKRKLLKTPVK